MALNTDEAVTTLWRTPDDIFRPLHKRYRFEVDAAAIAWNAKLPTYFTPEQNALTQDWAGKRVWLNPPYGHKNIEAFLEKAESERRRGALVLLLLPAHPDRTWFREHVVEPDGFTPKRGVKYWWYLGRIPFEVPPWVETKGKPVGNTQGSVFVLMRPLDPMKIYEPLCPVCGQIVPKGEA